jgi:MFS family permease
MHRCEVVGSAESPHLSHRQILEVLAGLMLGMFLAALDQTIVASAIRAIGDDLHGLSTQAGWFLAVFGMSSVLGPVIGGFFAGTDELLGIAGWRWVFLTRLAG